MKRKRLLSGILGILLVFGILLFTACPTDDNDTSGGTNSGDNGNNGDNTGGNNGGNNEDNQGGNNSDTRQEGVYIGIISFAGEAEDLTNGVPVLLNTAGKNTLLNKLSSGYAISSKSGTALFYAVHKALANLKSRDTQYPPKLDSVNVVTFTDGLDNGSTGMSAANPIEEKTFDSDNAYTTYLSGEITSRTIAGKPITAYSVGVAGNDVADTTKFQSDLAKIASQGKSQSLTDFGNLQSTFQSIANGLQITHTSTTFTMKTTLLSSGTKVRMTFDVTGMNPSDAESSSKYIEGTITRAGTGSNMTYTFGSITYKGGLGSSEGAGPISGAINGSEVNFTFTWVAGYNPSTDESKAKQWLKAPDVTAWQVNSEYDVGGATNTQTEKRSSIMYLVLDSSRSLNATQIGQIRSAATTFINSLYDQLNGSSPSTPSEPSEPSQPSTSLSAPTDVEAKAESSNSISVSWNSVSGASYYKIYRSGYSSGSYQLLDESTSTSFTDTGVSSNTTYYYKVSAVNNAGESAQSTYAYATTSSGSDDPYKPGNPTGDDYSGSSSATAITLYPGAQQSGALSSNSPEVWYRVTVYSGEAYYVWGKSESGVVFTIYEKSYGEDMKYLDDITIYSSGEYLLPSSGTYYIQVSPPYNYYYSTYSIGISSSY
ncbi:MAG: fibronectin type III domain-containing protein [Treponema sp.]|jgi:hypothetical protein|nr:fibronectin type III domain-containing protein [Treponema sp.]